MKIILLFYLTVAFASAFTQPNFLQDRKAVSIQDTSRRGDKIHIRCTSTLNKDSAPLLIMDGVVVDYVSLKVLDPQDIENIMVIKDTAASALYGCRASNGVVLITTKKAAEKRFYVMCKEDGSPVVGATVKIVKEKSPLDTIQLIADDRGEVVTRKLDTRKLYTAIVSSVGYEPQIISLFFTSSADQPLLYMKRKENVCEQVTVVAYPSRRIVCRCTCNVAFTRTWNKAPEKLMSNMTGGIYPNPVTNGGIIHWKIDQSFDGIIQVFNVSGALIQSETITGVKGSVLAHKLPVLCAGTYFVRLLGLQSSTGKLEKLVVQ